jgi:hypothetical protein
MTGKQTFVGAGGAGLVLLNFWTSPARQTVSSGVFTNSGDTAATHKSLAVLGGELLFVIVATLLAGMGDSFGSLMVAVIVALFVLFAINHYGGGVSTSSSSSTSSTATTGTVKGAAA